MTLVQREIALAAFRAGFAVGAAGKREGRHVVDPNTHKHWRRGFDAGRAAMASEEVAYRKEINS